MIPKTSLTGTRDDADRLQRINGVPELFRGAWYHGTKDPNLSTFTTAGPAKLFFTRSSNGGTAVSRYVLEVYLVKVASSAELHSAGAGDDGGTDPDDPRKKRSDWWLTISSSEADCLMVVAMQKLGPRQTDSAIDAEQAEERQASVLDGLLKTDWAKRQSQAKSSGGDA